MLTIPSSRSADRHISSSANRHISPSCWPSRLPLLLTVTSPHLADHPISPFEGSPRAGAAEYVQRGDVNCQIVTSPRPIDRHIFLSCWPSPLPLWRGLGDVNRQTVTSPPSADRHVSPFEGGWGDVNRQIVKSSNCQIAKLPNRQITKFANSLIC